MRCQEDGKVGQQAHMVHFGIKRHTRAFPPGPYDELRGGQPSKAGEAVKSTLQILLQNDPPGEGHLATFLTAVMPLVVLAQNLQVALSSSTLQTVLHRLGWRWRCPRLAMPQKTDPEKTVKQWRIARAVVEATMETVVLYADVSRIQFLPLLRAMWCWFCQQLQVPTPYKNVTCMIFGALDIHSGDWTYLIQEHMCKESFIAFLEPLLTVYIEAINLIENYYSSHTAYLVQDWLKNHPRLKLFLPPKYCSHLNPVEGIWLQLKNKIAANRLYASMKLLLETKPTFFIGKTPEKALDWADV